MNTQTAAAEATPQQVAHRQELYALVPGIANEGYLSLAQIEQFCALAGIKACAVFGMADPQARTAFGRYYGCSLEGGPQREPFLMPFKKTKQGRLAYQQALRAYEEAGTYLLRLYRHRNITQA